MKVLKPWKSKPFGTAAVIIFREGLNRRLWATIYPESGEETLYAAYWLEEAAGARRNSLIFPPGTNLEEACKQIDDELRYHDIYLL